MRSKDTTPIKDAERRDSSDGDGGNWKQSIVSILQSRVKELEEKKQEDEISLKDCIRKLYLISKRVFTFLNEVLSHFICIDIINVNSHFSILASKAAAA